MSRRFLPYSVPLRPARPGGDCLERIGPELQKELAQIENCGPARHDRAEAGWLPQTSGPIEAGVQAVERPRRPGTQTH